MSAHHSLTRRTLHAFVAVALIGAMAAVGTIAAAPAGASSVPPVIAPEDNHVTADALPTVQINGVVYDQTIVGNTVYAVGQFTSARPAGSPPGVNEVPRSNMLAYDLTTGELIQSFAPTFNGSLLKAVTASPDGSRVYVGGLFNNVSGSTKYSIVALNATTGNVIESFTPILNYMVNDIVATDTTVYVGGAFVFAGSGLSFDRPRLAAFSASNGALLSWSPSANNEVHAMVMSPKGDRLFVGGAFDTINGESAVGLAALDPVTGAKLDWPVDSVVRNSGDGAAILTLTTDGESIFGGGWAWGQTQGNLEGLFSANPDTGEINWIEDCHGDTYSAAAVNGSVFTAGHPHYCGNLGGFPQTQTWAVNMRHALSFSTEARGVLKREQWGYYNFEGIPAPSQFNWYPEWTVGTHTGASQATWSVDGNEDYVVYGGEFLRVNNQAQQGLVRFAVKPIAPARERPQLADANYPITLRSEVAGQVRLTVAANFDRDDRELHYRITRNGVTVHETDVESSYWDRPIVSFLDSGLAPGSTQTYRVWVTDDDGNASASPNQSITVAGSGSASAYADQVLADGAQLHWRLDSSSGGDTPDSILARNGSASSVSFGAAGAVPGGTAANFFNFFSSRIVESNRDVLPDNLTIEAWVRTNTTDGGRIAGFSESQSGSSGATDRLLYMSNDGRVNFGVRTRVEGSGPNASRERRTVRSQAGLNDNQWHHVVGTLGTDGMNLYVDGVRVDSRPDTTGGQTYYGYFRAGADTLTGWPNRPRTDYLSGQLDELAVYHSVLTPTQIAKHYELSGRTPGLSPEPADAYGAEIHGEDPYLYYRLDEPSGATANDSGIRNNDGEYDGSVGRGASGLVSGNTAADFGGGFVASDDAAWSPQNYSLEAWFDTTSTNGGSIVAFGDSRTGDSADVDRQVYMRDDGRLAFRAGGAEVTSESAYNDGEPHHVVAVQGQGGMRLFVDGTQVGADPNRVAESFTGYWKVGRDVTPQGASSNAFDGIVDEVAVYDRELSEQDVLDHLTLGGGEVQNLDPTASFTVGGSFLQLTVDGSGSSDADGTIQSYEWDFGDGSSGSGVTAGHTYASAGTYTVTLTVTDDDGGVGQVSQQVVVEAEPPNVSPSAAFSSEVTDLAVALDGSGSSDPDGTIQSYEWDFGDGSSGSGVTAGHTYASAGTYTVTLTVTDDDGASDTATGSVVVTEPTGAVIHAADTFERSVSNGWGSADTGGAWTNSGSASWYSVTGGQGRHYMNAPGRFTRSTLGSVSATDVTFGVDLSFDKAPSGGGYYSSVAVRRVGNNEYRFRVRALPTQTEIYIDRTADGSGALLAAALAPGLVYEPGDVWRLELDATGTNPTTLTAKVWDVSGAEPAQPQLTVTDSTPALQGPGGVGVDNFLSGSVTNAPVFVNYDNLLAATGEVLPPPNEEPTAAFGTQIDNLAIAVDGSGSSDADGTIQSYEWDFGDGSSGSGVTAGHTYASAGTYTVTLTVTDDDGGVGQVSQQVTVAENLPNVSPSAAFSSEVTDLAVALDGSGSSDPDGTIQSYEWDFGDGSSGSGVTAGHTYASAGTYTVTLTVTDDDGASDTATGSVVVTEPTGAVIHAADTFERSVSNGWGSADTGGAWTNSGSASWYSVTGGQGRHYMNAPGRFTRSTLGSVSATDVTFGVDLSFDKAPSGGGYYSSVAVRRVGNNEYRFRVRALPTQTEIYIDRTADGSGALLAAALAPGLVYEPGDVWRLELDATGTNPTTLTAKVWDVSGAEPAQPQLTVTDSTPALQGPGGVGVDNFLSGSVDNTPVYITYDNLIAREED